MTGYSKINRKALPKYAGGGSFFDNNSSAITGGANLLASGIDSINTGDGTSTGSVIGGTFSGALKGAAAGTAILPGVGTAVGTGIGLVSGLVGGLGKRSAALQQRRMYSKSAANNALRQSNQVLAQYDSNGVPTTLYAAGGYVNGGDSTIVQTNAYGMPMIGRSPLAMNINAPYSKINPLMVDKGNGTIGQWGNDLNSKKPVIIPQGKPVIHPAQYTNPTSFDSQQLGRNLQNLPSIQTPSRPSANYGSRYSKGGRIKLNPNVELPEFSLMADGGNLQNPDYEAEKNEVIQGNPQLEEGTELASDMHLVGGSSHENGGTMGSGGERIFSDRLKISPELKDILKSQGIKISDKSTYADVSNKIGRLKGKFEDKTDGIGRNTAKLMIPRLEQSLDATFNDQEIGKTMKSYKKFAKGGIIPKYPDGGNPFLINGVKALNVPLMNQNKVLDEVQINGGQVNRSTLPRYSKDVPSASFGQRPINYTTDNSPAVLADNQSTFAGKAISGIGDYLNNNGGQVANAASYLANLGSINSLDTSVNPAYMPNPTYNYVDRSAPAYNRNNSLLRTGIKSLNNSGRTVNAANIGSLYAKTLEGNSIIADNEGRSRDSYNNIYSQRSDRINEVNNTIFNKAQEDSRDLKNQKTGLKVSARNAFLQGVMGNQAQKQAKDLEDKKLLTTLATNDQNGVMTRFLKNYPTYKKLLNTYQSSSK